MKWNGAVSNFKKSSLWDKSKYLKQSFCLFFKPKSNATQNTVKSRAINCLG